MPDTANIPEEVKPIEDKKDMAEQRKLFDSIRPGAMPFDFSTEPETAPPLPTDGFYSPEELAEIYGIEPPSEILPSSENPETVAVPQTVTIVETPESPEIQPETEQLPDFDELPPIPDPPIETVPTPVNETIPQNPIETAPPPINETTPINTTAPEVTEPETATPTQQPEESPLEEVKEVNRQAIAWLTIPDTDLDYPIAQADDNEFYLWKGFNGLRNGTGTPFLDYRCKPDFSGYNSIIYGHNMEQMLMFATIRLYRDKSFMEEHPEGWLLLDDGLHKIQFFAFLSVQSDSAIYPGSLEILHGARSTLLCTRQILKTSDGLLRAEVDDQEVRSRGTLLCLPVG